MGGASAKTRWRVHDNGGGLLGVHLVGILYMFYLFGNNNNNNYNLDYGNWIGCQEDNEGSWGIGVFYGDDPFSLKPIEDLNIWDNKSAAWPVANPIMTCASITDSGFSSNFVADPFLYAQVHSFVRLLTVKMEKN
ncbi:hypothetical protein M8C21_010961 [Ambrosia artemisiifolia]|uniref:Glucosamine inositolphosphorylceramide transferase 1 N-terminal domain-containing protein n=1 Tax=Ambrosia artemisiifolia TaxID=4212 RepID=A0AAD5GUU3_AMBAR|nr:hypothetical protein M8C21_010961 [Ambrosia artemisiifolia]